MAVARVKTKERTSNGLLTRLADPARWFPWMPDLARVRNEAATLLWPNGRVARLTRDLTIEPIVSRLNLPSRGEIQSLKKRLARIERRLDEVARGQRPDVPQPRPPG